MEYLKTIQLDYPDGMSDADKQAMDERLNALFQDRQFTSESEMVQAVQTAVKSELGIEMQVAPLPGQLWLGRSLCSNDV
ncbi:MAG: hypothetical protein AAGA83_10570 [Cyanobacteria bacterium P01_F01_bin.116]